ncbi:MAG TPA: ATP synthase F1 subunit gamma [Erysipelotrichaceae bacterium]|jgi:F-type H+-transporting ATPase subunit gamma|nr:ATP synthase F1 subunit gamma [Erysipelotrichia bacterium]HPX32254.1 ATP synthase F1 subunit gamma [Erysipelotrichaceae bacterium]HQA84765.1 ATP synthase F1 subunit gamma [Erysipelotrichaceae bacterium]
MAGQISMIKRQLKSVQSTQKLTNAMALVATAKLQKQKNKMIENNEYADIYHTFLLAALSAKREGEETNLYLKPSTIDNPAHIIITSNSGLCGSYNQDLLKYVEKHISKDEPIFAIGTYGIKWLKANNYMVIKEYNEWQDLEPAKINQLITDLLILYQNDMLSSIDVIYTQYVNALTFLPTTFHLLPIKISGELIETEMLLEPSREEVLNQLIPMYVSSQIYSTFLQAKTSEHAARRSAMDNANKNADDLINELELTYNQARQAAITQEMNEITAGTVNSK